jgi:hypothetical protein
MLETLRPWFEAPLFLIPVTALATALVAEPLKNALSNMAKRRQLRRIVLMEMVGNLRWLDHERESSAPFGSQYFRDSVKRKSSTAAYASCQREFYLYYQLPEHEWIDGFYTGLDRITGVSPISATEREPEAVDLAKDMVGNCAEYLRQHPNTWSVIGADAPPFLREQVKPTFRVKWIDAWRKLRSDCRELRSKSDSYDETEE